MCHRCIGVHVVYTRLLCEPFRNHAHLVMNDLPIRVALVVENRLRRDDFSPSWNLVTRNEVPYFVITQGFHLILVCGLPLQQPFQSYFHTISMFPYVPKWHI